MLLQQLTQTYSAKLTGLEQQLREAKKKSQRQEVALAAATAAAQEARAAFQSLLGATSPSKALHQARAGFGALEALSPVQPLRAAGGATIAGRNSISLPAGEPT